MPLLASHSLSKGPKNSYERMGRGERRCEAVLDRKLQQQLLSVSPALHFETRIPFSICGLLGFHLAKVQGGYRYCLMGRFDP